MLYPEGGRHVFGLIGLDAVRPTQRALRDRARQKTPDGLPCLHLPFFRDGAVLVNSSSEKGGQYMAKNTSHRHDSPKHSKKDKKCVKKKSVMQRVRIFKLGIKTLEALVDLIYLLERIRNIWG